MNPTDRTKSGTKRSLLVEGSGVPIGLYVARANRHDSLLFAETIWSTPVDRPEPTPAQPQHLCLDCGYDYERARWLTEAFGFVAHVRSRGEKVEAKEKNPAQEPRRWVVERTHGWMNRFRSLLIRWAKSASATSTPSWARWISSDTSSGRVRRVEAGVAPGAATA